MDNFYTSPKLLCDLRANGFGACDTLRINHRGLPNDIKESIKEGQKHSNSTTHYLESNGWINVTALTTIHSDTTVEVERRSRHAISGQERVQKPQAIVEYNKYMGGVDQADQLLSSYYGFGHRTVKWWKRAFLFFLDMAVVNSYMLYMESTLIREEV